MAEKVLMKGNEAIAEAAVRAGCRFYFAYPITPQNEIPAYMAKRLPEVGGTFLQAESELAAINMVMGASAAGSRCMTSSSSPGISLKQEGISYISGAEGYRFKPCRAYQGFNLFAKFDKNGKVTFAGNHRYLRDGNANKYTEFFIILEKIIMYMDLNKINFIN